MVLCRVGEVLPVGYFCPLDADGADAVSALGAGAMHPVVDHWQGQGGEQVRQLLPHLCNHPQYKSKETRAQIS